MSLLAALRSRLRRYPAPADAEAVRDMTTRQWAGIARRTPTYLAAYRDWPGSDDRAQRRAEWVAALPVFRQAETVLEIGCGAGRNLAALRRRHPDLLVYGRDINAEAIAQARATLPEGHFTMFNLYDLATCPSLRKAGVLGIDVVLAVGVLGHLEPSAVPAVLGWMLSSARQAVVIVDELGAGQVLKGPRAWNPRDRVSQDYVLYAHDLLSMVIKAGGLRVRASVLPPELRAPAATDLIVVDTGGEP